MKNPDGSPNRRATPVASHPRTGAIGFENKRYFAWFREILIRELHSQHE